MSLVEIILVIILVVSCFIMYLMNIRIKQLRQELDDLRDRVMITGEELMLLSKDIEDFKKINI